MRRLFAAVLTTLTLTAGLIAAATPAQAACVLEHSFTEVNNAVPGTIDGNIAIWTSYGDCGTWNIIYGYKFDQFSGPAVRGYYSANIAWYSGGTKRLSGTGLSFSENVWQDATDTACTDPCTMLHNSGSRSDVISWPDGTLDYGTDTIN